MQTILWCFFPPLFLVSIAVASGRPLPTPPAPLTPVSWEVGHPERKPWTVEATKQVSANLTKFESAKDIANWCPNYQALNGDNRIQMWVTMATGIAFYESGFNPNSIYNEPPPLSIASVGLFQLSYSDGLPGCKLNAAAKSLQDPLNNIDCAIPLMGKLIARDSIVTSGNTLKSGANQARGLGRYWSTMWAPTANQGHADAIKILTRKYCAGVLK